MSEYRQQLWQGRIMKDITDSADGEYNKEYVMPRGSGASTLFLNILKEFNILFRDENIKTLMIVPSKNRKRFVESFNTTSQGSFMTSLSLISGSSIPEENKVIVISADEEFSQIRSKLPSHIDWLLVDGVDDDNAILSYVKELHINNRLIIRTI